MWSSQQLALPQWGGGPGGFYEAYFVILTAPETGLSLWLRWLLLVPQRAGVSADISLWAMGCGPDGVRFAQKEVRLQGRQVHPAAWQSLVLPLTAGKAYSRINGGEVIADLQWEAGGSPSAIFPYPWMYTAGWPRSKSCSPVSHAVARGSVRLAEETVVVENATVSMGHLWGTQMADQWAWVQVPSMRCQLSPKSVKKSDNVFQTETADTLPAGLEALTAQITVGSFRSPKLTLAAFSDSQVQHNLNRPTRWALQDSVWTGTEWHVSARQGDWTLEYQCRADPASIIGVTYLAPDGSRRYCYHSDAATVRGQLRRRNASVQNFFAEHARFETVASDPISELPLLL